MKILATIFALTALSFPALAGLTPEQTRQASAEIDALLAAQWKSAGVAANAPISDETFLRRIYLDLAGRIPTSGEAAAFLNSKAADKRAALIGDLLARESYVSHFYNFWADILRYKSSFVNTSGVIPAAYAKFIKESLRANKPYDQFVRELLSAKGYAWDNGAVGYYGRDPEMPLDNMAITSRIFLGTRIECAQCHNHPFDKWKQTDFYHLAAYTYGNKPVSEAFHGVREAFKEREQVILDDFKREKAAAPDGGKAAEQRKKERMEAMEFRPVLNLIRHGIGQLFSPIGLERRDSVLKLPGDFHQSDGKPGEAIQAKPIFGAAPAADATQDPAEIFARWATSPENPRFTRVIVNRLWKKMFGVALTEPLDELRDESTTMAPDVEARLIKLMVSLKYDLRAFLAVIANTRSYQAAASHEEFAPGSVYPFTGPLLRRMTAEQVWDSLVALANDEPDMRGLAREAREQRRIDISHMAADAYLNFDGKKIVELGYARLQAEKELEKTERAAREAEIAAKRAGDQAKAAELHRVQGRIERERNEIFVREFLTPVMANLAQLKTGSATNIAVDETYKMNTNPSVFAVETWRRMHIPGYGPAPKTAAQIAADAQAEQQRLSGMAAKLGLPENERPRFLAYCEKARTEWLRASELESPAPRGHFLRTMGQSDRDFVENANPNASIPQALALMNGDLISEKGLLSPYSPLMRFINSAKTSDARIDAAYFALLSRHPTTVEKTACSKALTGTLKSVEDLVYALLNTKQFIFIQ